MIGSLSILPASSIVSIPMLRPVSLPGYLTPGKLFLSSMPGYEEPLDVFLDQITDEQVGHILCLVSDDEIDELSPDYLSAINHDEIPAKIWQHEIPDHGMPENRVKLLQDIDCLRKLLAAGESVVIHCAAGEGRTGLVATMLLIRMGFSLPVASRTIEQAGSTPGSRKKLDLLQEPT